MAYPSAAVAASGANFAAFQSGGASGLLEALIAANLSATAAPTAAPTLSETGSGNTLPAATYYVQVTETNAFGETTPSPTSSGQAITLGQALVVTFPSLKTGNTARNVYVGTASGGPFTLAATGQTGSTCSITAPLPTNSYAVAPPTFSTTGLTFTDASGVVQDKALSLIRSAKDGNLQDVFRFLAGTLSNFNTGQPVAFNSAMTKLNHARGTLALLVQLCTDAGALMDANPGHLTTAATPVGGSRALRVWP